MSVDLKILGTLDKENVNVLSVALNKYVDIGKLYDQIKRAYPDHKFVILVKSLKADFTVVSKEEMIANLKMNLAELEKDGL